MAAVMTDLATMLGLVADWADSIARNGRVLYTNVIYWKALQEMSEAASYFELKDQISFYAKKAERVASAIQEHLWRPELGYFAASDALDQLASSGNLLAIAWGLASTEQANSIMDALIVNGMASPVPTKVAYPPYPRHLIALENRLGGVANYHTDAAWLWIGAWHVVALARSGRPEEAHAILARIAEVIVRDQQVHEVYGPNGQPLSSFGTSLNRRSHGMPAWSCMPIMSLNILWNQKPISSPLSARMKRSKHAYRQLHEHLSSRDQRRRPLHTFVSR